MFSRFEPVAASIDFGVAFSLLPLFATAVDAATKGRWLSRLQFSKALGGTSAMEDAGRKNQEPPFLNTVEAAAWLRLTKNTLEKMRVQGNGPVYRKHGRCVLYHIEDLVDYSKASLRRCTSDAD
jgi:hypothetical protein